MCDTTAGLIPESTLPYCGISRQEWINAPVVLLRDAIILLDSEFVDTLNQRTLLMVFFLATHMWV